MDSRRPDPRLLTEHADFLRGLARSLLDDEHAAEDVVQGTYLAALKSPPRPGNLRGWLATVARNLAFSLRRGERRRGERERAARRLEPLPSPDEIAARLDVQRRVVEAVIALAEPYRSVVVHRFYYGLTLKEIAAHVGEPQATVRTRLRRALAQLRGRLDRGGGRDAWAVALVPLALMAPATREGGISVAARATIGCAVVATVGLLWSAGRAGDDAVPRPPRKGAPPAPPTREDGEPAPAPPAKLPQPPSPREEEAPPPPKRDPVIEVKRDPAPPQPVRKSAPSKKASHEREAVVEQVLPAVPAVSAFVQVPAGAVHPGCTDRDFRRRATTPLVRRHLVYERWSANLAPVALGSFLIGRHEITNAQWKLYLDANFRVERVTRAGETLGRIAAQHGARSGWRAIYALNAETVREALGEDWPLEDPPALDGRKLPEGLKLVFFRHHTPSHWYGWCKLSHLNTGREYCDVTLPPADAFRVPDRLSLRDGDFAGYPVRDVAPLEALAFAEWAGCQLPSEYEWERAARGDRPNTDQHPFPGPWDRNADRRRFAWVDNPACARGPLAVHDPSVARGDSPFGARQMLGNVWEICRTFYDRHPLVVPSAPPHPDGLFNYALTAKGGAWGDGWILLQISTRTGQIGNGDLGLRHDNHMDSLGLRLVRHRPGYDLLLHSIRRLSFSRTSGQWSDPLPHAYAVARMAGADETDIAKSPPPFLHVKGKAEAVAFAPLWFTRLNETKRRQAARAWRAGRAETTRFPLGVLRCDVAIRAGVRLTDREVAELKRSRALTRPNKQRNATGEDQEEARPAEPEPPPPDEYELATERNQKSAGLWRERTVPPGEWVVVYWNGFFGLVDRTGTLEAILFMGKPVRRRADAGPAVLQRTARAISLRFQVEEQRSARKPQTPPGVEKSELWALCEVHPDGWPGRRRGAYCYTFEVEIPVAKR